jgi:mycothiol system anti-sigma-R factor
MNCEEAINLMDGYLDGELDPVSNQEIERHLRNCRRCEQAYEAQRTLVRAIGSAAPYYKAPAELRQRIQSSLRNEIGAKATRNGTRGSQVQRRQKRSIVSETPWNWLALAAAILFAAIIASTLFPRMRAPGGDQFLATQLIASHVRSLMADHLTDVASSDQHTVKPWLDAKLDFAAPVVDLAGEGFPLVGGRLDYLDNHSVAALVYQRRKHFINLFIWPTTPADSKEQKMVEHQGYHLLHWIDGDFTCWAVSDVNTDDLQNFKQLFEGQTTRR